MRKLQATSALSHLSGVYVPLSLSASRFGIEQANQLYF